MLDHDVRNSLTTIVSGAGCLDDAIESARTTPSTIDQHWDVMRRYASECDSIAEYGTGFSTLAWLSACSKVRSADVERHDWMDRLLQIAEGKLEFVHGTNHKAAAVDCDLLFIDTLHEYDQLRQELTIHAPRCRKFIVVHDTESFGFSDSPLTVEYGVGGPGLRAAISEFLESNGEWSLAEHFTNQHGLTILARSKTA